MLRDTPSTLSHPATYQQLFLRACTQVRMVAGTFLLNPQGPYKTLEDLWDEPETPQPPKPAPGDAM